MSTQQLIQKFLDNKRFAMPGVSRNPKEFSRLLYKEFLTRGYDVLPLNPLAEEIDGRTCYKHISEIRPAVTAALIMTPKSGMLSLLQDCVASGVSFVWFYGISGTKDVEPGALQFCRQHEIKHIAGYCPYMFLPSAAWYHRLHGCVWNALGKVQ